MKPSLRKYFSSKVGKKEIDIKKLLCARCKFQTEHAYERLYEKEEDSYYDFYKCLVCGLERKYPVRV